MDSKREYELGTRRLAQLLSKRETEPSQLAEVRYGYDPTGNIIKTAEVPTSGAADIQCFAYDRLRRLTEAWTPASGDCLAARSQAALGGPAPYWQSFSYDAVGNRRTSTDRTPTGSTERIYTYPDPGTPQPHTLRTVQTTGGGTTSYTYDETGTRSPSPVRR